MRALLDYLGNRTVTLTVYNFDGTDEQWQTLTERLGNYGVELRADASEYETPTNVGLLHDNDELLDTVSMSTLTAWISTDDSDETARPDVLSRERRPTIKPSRSIADMMQISREFERRAWRTGEGSIHAGFQRLSSVANSERTIEVYERLAETGIEVTVYGYPDTELSEVPFTVVEDTERELDAYWFLLFDGAGEPTRNAALVSEECADPQETVTEQRERDPMPQAMSAETRTYDSYWTTEPQTVDRLYELAYEAHPSVLRSNWTPSQ